MVIHAFPSVDDAHHSGLLAVGGDLHEKSLLLAYQSGIFPWPLTDGTLAWFSPPTRAVIILADAKVPRTLRKVCRKMRWDHIHNQRGEEVIRCCRNAHRPNQSGTWLTEEMVTAYVRLHKLGFCHTFAAITNRDDVSPGELLGGLYGIKVGRMFAGESMFYNRPNGSKVAFYHLLNYLREQDALFIDCQVMTPLVESFGAVTIDRSQFMELLAESLS